jgi:ribosomal protein S18 acetylase RimI-like enzyme
MKSGEITVERAALADLDAAKTVIERAYRGDTAAASWSHEGELPTGQRVSRDVLSALFERPTSILSLAKLGDRIVGTSLVQLAVPKGCEIGLLSVEPDLQGHGIGDYLIRCAERDGAAHFRARRSFVEVIDQKPALIAYYRRRGYRATGSSRPYPHRLEKPATLLTFAKQLSGKSFEP